jgi:hypothetical protein
MKWLQFHLIATQTAQNHIIFMLFNFGEKEKEKPKLQIPTLNN